MNDLKNVNESTISVNSTSTTIEYQIDDNGSAAVTTKETMSSNVTQDFMDKFNFMASLTSTTPKTSSSMQQQTKMSSSDNANVYFLIFCLSIILAFLFGVVISINIYKRTILVKNAEKKKKKNVLKKQSNHQQTSAGSIYWVDKENEDDLAAGPFTNFKSKTNLKHGSSTVPSTPNKSMSMQSMRLKENLKKLVKNLGLDLTLLQSSSEADVNGQNNLTASSSSSASSSSASPSSSSPNTLLPSMTSEFSAVSSVAGHSPKDYIKVDSQSSAKLMESHSLITNQSSLSASSKSIASNCTAYMCDNHPTNGNTIRKSTNLSHMLAANESINSASSTLGLRRAMNEHYMAIMNGNQTTTSNIRKLSLVNNNNKKNHVISSNANIYVFNDDGKLNATRNQTNDTLDHNFDPNLKKISTTLNNNNMNTSINLKYYI